MSDFFIVLAAAYACFTFVVSTGLLYQVSTLEREVDRMSRDYQKLLHIVAPDAYPDLPNDQLV